MKKFILIGFVIFFAHSSSPEKRKKNTPHVYYNTLERKYDDDEIIGAAKR